ncbi:MAG: hypothetical protein M3008_13195 [Chloroflexota bacterium]|nr:hypothetical protein [Chloroflexota bacterium]
MNTIATVSDPSVAYDALYAEAIRLAGEPDDIAQRAAILHRIYLDSGGNHPFPLIVLHGALWADRFLRHIPHLIAVLRCRYVYDRERQNFYALVLSRFAHGLKTINRQVFIDTYTNFYFTRQFGHPAAASLGILPPDLSAALAAMHEATRAGLLLSAGERRRLYLLCLQQEQETTVAPGVEREVARFICPLLRRLCLRPPVRFAYFPGGTCYLFRDFASKQERVARAVAAYDLAERTGWAHVVHSIQDYGVLPVVFFDDPAHFVDCLIAWLRVAPDSPAPVPARCRGLSSSALPIIARHRHERWQAWSASLRIHPLGRD